MMMSGEMAKMRVSSKVELLKKVIEGRGLEIGETIITVWKEQSESISCNSMYSMLK